MSEQPCATRSVSILIPTYNGVQFVTQAVTSALVQGEALLEVIVVDDGSCDGTVDLLKSISDPRLIVLTQLNAGTAAARNTALTAAKGRLCALLDHDDVMYPGHLHTLVRPFCDEAVSLAYAGVEYFLDGTLTSRVKAFPSTAFEDHHAWCRVNMQAAVFQTELLRQDGGFDVRASGADDWDAVIRLAQAGKLVAIDETVTRINLHRHNQGSNPERMYTRARYVVEKHASLHPGNARRARRRLRAEFYHRQRSAARVAPSRRQSLVRTLVGLVRYPEAVISTPLHHLRQARDRAHRT